MWKTATLITHQRLAWAFHLPVYLHGNHVNQIWSHFDLYITLAELNHTASTRSSKEKTEESTMRASKSQEDGQKWGAPHSNCEKRR
jgi:hypothetical protein